MWIMRAGDQVSWGAGMKKEEDCTCRICGGAFLGAHGRLVCFSEECRLEKQRQRDRRRWHQSPTRKHSHGEAARRRHHRESQERRELRTLAKSLRVSFTTLRPKKRSCQSCGVIIAAPGTIRLCAPCREQRQRERDARKLEALKTKRRENSGFVARMREKQRVRRTTDEEYRRRWLEARRTNRINRSAALAAFRELTAPDATQALQLEYRPKPKRRAIGKNLYRENTRKKYAADPEYRKRCLERNARWHKEHRDHLKAYRRWRYANDSEYRERIIAKQKQRIWGEKERAYQREYGRLKTAIVGAFRELGILEEKSI